MSRRGWLLFAAMCVVWGVPYLLIRVAVEDFAPSALVFVRTALGGLVLVPFAWRLGGFGQVLKRWRPLLAFTAIEIAVPWLLLTDAERHLSSSLTGLLVAAVPLVGVLVGKILGSDDPGDGVLRYVGLLLGVAGVAVLLGLDLGSLRPAALIEMLFVVIGYAVGPLIMARRLADLPSIPVISASLLITAVVYSPFAASRVPAQVSAKAAWSVVGLALVCTALAFVLFFALIAEIGPARSTVITYVNPAVALLLGVVLLGERFTLGIALGFPLVLLGSVLAARRGRSVAGEASAATCVVDEDADAQSTRTSPEGVAKDAATSPEPSDEDSHSTSTPSSGWRAEVPK